MIKLKFSELKSKIGKSLTEIAKETGLNRNTINAIFAGKADGFKLETLDKFCKTYGLQLPDLLEYQPEKSRAKVKYYKQEGEVSTFLTWPWFILVNKLDPEFFREGFGELKGYFKEGYGTAYWQIDQLNKLSRSVYEDYGSGGKIDDIYQVYLERAEKLEKLYHDFETDDYLPWNNEKSLKYFYVLAEAFYDFWSVSLFIDSFDAGFDHEAIDRLAQKSKLTTEEISSLTNPAEMTFSNERLLVLLKIVKKIKNDIARKKLSLKQLDKYLIGSPLVNDYLKRFDYYKSNYLGINHITREEVKEEIIKYLNDQDFFNTEYDRLIDYSDNQAKEVKKILKKHHLKSNPLYFFNRLTYWREHRKMVNLMGIYLLDMFLLRLEKTTGIAKKYLQCLTFDEIDNVSRGLIKKEDLMKRYHDGVLISIDKGDYKIIEGKEAGSLKKDLDESLDAGKKDESIAGKVASQGYAKGFARIILKQNDFNKFKAGEILVTVMTRPEYVPIMKKAAGIVTDEGGITCHAAIVSRELNKPCIIGTQNATKLIKTGDLIEVRANHGTVRILKRAK